LVGKPGVKRYFSTPWHISGDNIKNMIGSEGAYWICVFPNMDQKLGSSKCLGFLWGLVELLIFLIT
jgi:hypothetical protein